MNKAPEEELSFEKALERLEAVVRELEDGQTGLEESLAKYEQGVGLLKRCYAQLRQAEQRILELTGQDSEGQAVGKPFEHASTLEQARKDRPAL